MLIGATFKDTEISYWEPKLPRNSMMRIFPNSDGLPPPWSDSRFEYCRRVGAIPFISTKIDGDNTKLQQLQLNLGSMPFWITKLYMTDRHEPEGDVTASAYQANFNEYLSMVNGLPASIRSIIRCGPVLTRQWTENTSGRTYDTHDPGTGDFFGVDMYANSWGANNTAATSYPNPVTFLSRVKAYRKNMNDTRPRIFPELGAVGLPFDTDGSARAAWLRGLYEELKTWTEANQGWSFEGWVWWNTDGKSGADLAGIGTARYFQLDRRHTGSNNYVTLDPPRPLNEFSAIAAAEATPPPPQPNPDDPQYQFGYQAGLGVGYTNGYNDGKAVGRTEGIAEGRDQAFGETAAWATSRQND